MFWACFGFADSESSGDCSDKDESGRFDIRSGELLKDGRCEFHSDLPLWGPRRRTQFIGFRVLVELICALHHYLPDEVLGMAGRGTFGTVLDVMDKKYDERIALKVVRSVEVFHFHELN